MAHSQLRNSKNFIWNIGDLLGRGATADVFVGRCKQNGDECAVKVFNNMSHLRPLEIQMREFEVLKKLKHQNIVKLFNIEEEVIQGGTRTGNRVLVMEYCTGGSLYHVLEEPENAQGLAEDEFLLFLKHVSAGMKHIKENGIVHRDIKPGNIMRAIDQDGSSIYKLTDFGAARELNEGEQFMSLYGTEEYLHPDMYERAVMKIPAGKKFDDTVDLWSLGVTIYHTATGQLPFRPYGGRRNKQTMYKITTEKDSGIISGVQLTEQGPIEWSRELPKTCKLSKGLKNLLTPLIAGLLENHPFRMWGFDQFFTEVTKLMEKKVVHVFSTCTSESLRIYMEKNDKFAGFQELIAEQTEVRAAEQMLLFQWADFSDVVTPLEEAHKYPLTTPQNPVFLFNESEGSVPTLLNPTTLEFPQMGVYSTLEADAAAAKTCCGIMYRMKSNVQDQVQSMRNLVMAAKMYSDVVIRKAIQMQDFAVNFSNTWEETQCRLKDFEKLHNGQKHLLSICKGLCGGSVADLVKTSIHSLTDTFNQAKVHHDSIEKRCTNACIDMEQVFGKEDSNKLIEPALRTVVRKMQNAVESVLSTERWEAKLDYICDQTVKILIEFRRDKNIRRLSFNEEQIHKFTRKKLHQCCEKGNEAQQGCTSHMMAAHSNFTSWLGDAQTFHNRLEELGTKLEQAEHDRTELSIIIDKCQEDYSTKYENACKCLESANVTTDSPTSDMPHMLTGHPTSSREIPTIDSIPKRQQRKEILKNLSGDLRSLREDTGEIKTMLNENRELLNQFSEMQLLNNGFLDQDEGFESHLVG